jgi:hypothetical protein
MEKKMKKVIITSLIALMFAGTTWALESEDGTKLTGAHYNLNIIGVQNPKTADMDSDTGTGGVIFVNLSGKTKIGLVESGSADAPEVDPDDYAVLDKNGTDNDGALLALPDPGLDPYIVGDDMTGVDTMSDYSIFVRPLGKPLGYAKITTCATVVESEFLDYFDKDAVSVLHDAAYFGGVASIEQVGQDVTFRNKGKTTFVNVTAELLTIVLKVEVWVDEDGDGYVDEGEVEIVYARIPIFDDILMGEYWEYDNTGLKLLQVRFYPIETDVSAGDGDLPALP